MQKQHLLQGNQAMARGLVENGCRMATSYPGTPASEILAAVAQWRSMTQAHIHVQWAINEKVAFEIAYTGSISGLRAAVAMKQVGLNVASDALMSAAYMGVMGGFIVIVADDPGPHSSQTEQDSRMFALMAKIPVLDPGSPQQAREMIAQAYALSEEFEIPVMLRPTTRVCHARQNMLLGDVQDLGRTASFKKDPSRWAATPKFRLQLHQHLEDKLARLAAWKPTAPILLNPEAQADCAVVVSGVAAAHTRDIFAETGLLADIPLYQVRQPFPLHQDFITDLMTRYRRILVLEETMPVIEMQLADRVRVQGKLNHSVPRVGELLPETIEKLVLEFNGRPGKVVPPPASPARRPTLCAGCPHRASFFAIKKAAPRGIYTSDIGCYTLGLNLGAVDTVLCMGAAISQAAGFYQAHKDAPKPPDIIATIGDSTFFHAGLPPLIDAVNQKVRFVLMILDNATTAMTGNQPTPATGVGAMGEALQTVDIARVVSGCGIDFCRIADPYDTPSLISLLKEALKYCRENGPAVIIARRPCLLDRRQTTITRRPPPVIQEEDCDGCGYCLKHFECPALMPRPEADTVMIDAHLCTGCGVCRFVCPLNAIGAEVPVPASTPTIEFSVKSEGP